MKFILAAPGNTPGDWPLIQKAVIEAEEQGFWAFLLPDHYMGGTSFGGDSTLDTWIALSYLATLTDKIKLGSLVTPIPLRPPALLAKIVSTFDLLTEGRAVLGVGAGSSQAEFDAYSQGETPRFRFRKTREGVELIRRLWTENKVDFQGKFYRATGAVLEPKPYQKPHPPLLFGGMGRGMMEIAGTYADICLVPLSEPEIVQAKEALARGGRLRTRKGELSLAGAAESLPQPWKEYDRAGYLNKLLTANKYGCEYFIVPFPWKTYLESLGDFAMNIIPSF